MEAKLHEESPQIFYCYRFRPCKVDSDVLQALKDVEIDKVQYPAVSHWYQNVTAFSEQERGW